MLHVFIGEILANMTQVSDVAPGPLVFHMPRRNTVCLCTYFGCGYSNKAAMTIFPHKRVDWVMVLSSSNGVLKANVNT